MRMKMVFRKTIITVCVFLFSGTAFPEAYLIIHGTDPDVSRIPVSEIQKITFDLSGTSNASKRIALKRIRALGMEILGDSKRANIKYSLGARAPVKITVWDLQGRLVNTLLDETRLPGNYSVAWDGTGSSGVRVPSAPYLVRIQVNQETKSSRVFLVR